MCVDVCVCACVRSRFCMFMPARMARGPRRPSKCCSLAHTDTQVKNDGSARIFVLAMMQDDARYLLELAHKRGLVGPGVCVCVCVCVRARLRVYV